jgi:uncharacterized caspase-like protein
MTAIVDARREQKLARVRLALLTDPDAIAPKLAPAAPKAPAAQGRRLALVIGNGAYADAAKLANPANDARLIARNLKSLGFDVMEGIDADRRRLRQLRDDFLRSAATARLAIVYYAGHGLQIDGRNYLVPVDADLGAAGDPAQNLTDVDTMLTGLDDQIRTNIVILDACRDNPLAPSVPAPGAARSLKTRSGLAAPSELGKGATLGAGTLLAFATAPGQVALDGDGENSPFSAALARHIGTPGLELQQMLTRVRAEVVAATRSKQVPWSNSSLLGEVYLVGGR